MKSIDEQIAKLEEEDRRESSRRRQRIEELKAQKVCEHDWEFTPAKEGDSFCFQRDVGETIACKKCNYRLEKAYHPQYDNFSDEQRELFARVKKQLGVS